LKSEKKKKIEWTLYFLEDGTKKAFSKDHTEKEDGN